MRRVRQEVINEYHVLDRADPKWTIVNALACSVALELGASLMAWFSFSSAPYLVYTCGASLVFKFMVCAAKAVELLNARSFMQPLVLSMLGPWLVLLPLISYSFIQQCEHKLEESTFQTLFAWLHKAFGFEVPVTVYSHYAIHCPNYNVVILMPLTIQIGLPVLITHVVIKVSTTMWGFDLTDTYTRNGVRRLALDFADMAFFGTIAFHHSGLVFFKENPVWFHGFLAIFAIAFSATLFKSHHLACRGGLGSIIGKLKCCPSCVVGLAGTRLAEVFSLLLNTLPVVVVRGYFWLVGVQVSPVFLFKGVLCMVHEIALISTGNEHNSASTYIYKIVEMLPGTTELDKQTSIEVFQQTRGDLASQTRQLAVAKEEAENKQHLLELKEKQCQILTKFQRCFKGTQLPESDIKEIFDHFDFDHSDKLTLTEFERLVEMLDLEGELAAAARKLFKEIDKDHNGYVDHREFVQLMSRDWLELMSPHLSRPERV
jgi:hypothetical protein